MNVIKLYAKKTFILIFTIVFSALGVVSSYAVDDESNMEVLWSKDSAYSGYTDLKISWGYVNEKLYVKVPYSNTDTYSFISSDEDIFSLESYTNNRVALDLKKFGTAQLTIECNNKIIKIENIVVLEDNRITNEEMFCNDFSIFSSNQLYGNYKVNDISSIKKGEKLYIYLSPNDEGIFSGSIASSDESIIKVKAVDGYNGFYEIKAVDFGEADIIINFVCSDVSLQSIHMTVAGVFEEVVFEEILGDVNQDQNLSISDVTLIQSHIANFVTLDTTEQYLADYNRDEKVNIVDVTLIQQKLAN